MKIACTLTLVLLAAAVDGYTYGNGYASSQYSGVRPYGGRFAGSGYNGVPSGARAQNYYPNLASSYYNPYQSSSYNQFQTYNPYPTNTNNPYQASAYTSAIYNPGTQFVGSTLANQYLSSTSSSSQPAGNVCPATTSRTIIISDYIKYGVPQTYPCIGSCVFQPNSVLDNLSTQNYDNTDAVVLMVGPYSYPNTAFKVLNNATVLAALSARTNLYLTTVPVRPSVTDAAVLTATANVNTLVRSAATANPSASLLDYQTFYNTYVSNIESQWTGLQMCNWLREQLPTPVALTSTPAPAAVGTLAPF